ncbi:MAG: phosphoribosylaminoimidazolesuccinocarboxamide synthase [Proteobacteria bacterium]|nr:MAG: phosphoribosylaminoimidazolesuccinocarboxamide synthase [Pseudomonadota bacterium]
MEKREFLYEGKAKQVYATDNPDLIIIRYKDDATAFNNLKKGTINAKGEINNKITERLFTLLQEKGIKTHFHQQLNDREQLCEKVTIIPLEVIVRNLIAGSMAKRLNIVEGTKPSNTVTEISYKNDDLGDPLINDHHAVAIGAATYDELAEIYRQALAINEVLKEFFAARQLTLVDFKLEFGKNSRGEIILADEISPDTCRLWDSLTNEKLDKDRFRRDLGGVEEAYQEVLKRLMN